MIKAIVKIIYSFKLREEIYVEYKTRPFSHQIIHCYTDGLNIDIIDIFKTEDNYQFNLSIEGLNYRYFIYVYKNTYDIKIIKRIFVSLKYESFYKDKETENQLI